MTPFTVHTLESAPAQAKPLLENSRKTWGFIPTLHGTLAEAPVALAAYTTMYADIAERSTLTPQEQQVDYQAVTPASRAPTCWRW